MSEDEHTSLPISTGSAVVSLGQGDPDSSRELVIAVTAGGMLIDGDPKAVES